MKKKYFIKNKITSPVSKVEISKLVKVKLNLSEKGLDVWFDNMFYKCKNRLEKGNLNHLNVEISLLDNNKQLLKYNVIRPNDPYQGGVFD
jgi:hypothetical protein